jgi:hypothetical protein
MLGAAARATAVMSLLVVHIACSATRVLTADDPYANCVDLGDLSVLSYSQAGAEQRMRSRVLELGGDTLLFGVRGRVGRLSDSPDEIIERRSRLLTSAAVADAAQPPIVMTAEDAEDPDALATAETNAARRQTAAVIAASLKDAPGELWFYGAALRCSSNHSQ